MKAQHLSLATALYEERRVLLELIKKAQGENFNVVVGGSYLKGRAKDAARPAVVAELQREAVAIESELKKLGVELT